MALNLATGCLRYSCHSAQIPGDIWTAWRGCEFEIYSTRSARQVRASRRDIYSYAARRTHRPFCSCAARGRRRRANLTWKGDTRCFQRGRHRGVESQWRGAKSINGHESTRWCWTSVKSRETTKGERDTQSQGSFCLPGLQRSSAALVFREFAVRCCLQHS